MTQQKPTVSIICLAHNQAKYIKEAVGSAQNQSYSNIEIILVDDGSTDGGKQIMKELAESYQFLFIDLPESVGNCVAFNKGLRASEGDYIIDLAADDLLLSERVVDGLAALQNPEVGVNFTDVRFVNEQGEDLESHYSRDANGVLKESVPVGDVYQHLIERYFISTPSMMIKRQVLDELGGYDESLTFEDFDFWIRSARNWHYTFTDKILVKKRILKNSLSTRQFSFRNQDQKSILTVCQKIKQLNKTKSENAALRKRCLYELRQCLRYGNLECIPGFIRLML